MQLFFDAFGQPYVAFNDMASWHIGYNYTSEGQIRYAVKACDSWHHKTIFQQQGQSASPNPIHECHDPMMTLAEDGQTTLFACAQRSVPDPIGSNNDQAGPYPTDLRAFLASLQMQ